MVEPLSQTKETEILDSVLELVKTPYGNFAAINKLSQAINDPATLQGIVVALKQSEQGQQAFINCPLLGNTDLQKLHQLPDHTLGYAYADHMIRNGLTPLTIEKRVNDPFVFLGTHIAETHDIWHVVTGFDTDKVGEVKLEAFYVAQLGQDRLFLTLLAKNLLKTALYEMELCEQIMDGLTEGWKLGKQVKPLFGIQWNTLWETPLAELRLSLNIT